MTKSEIGSADFTIAKTFIPFFETFGTSVYEDMGRQLVQNFVKPRGRGCRASQSAHLPW